MSKYKVKITAVLEKEAVLYSEYYPGENPTIEQMLEHERQAATDVHYLCDLDPEVVETKVELLEEVKTKDQ